MTKRAQQAANKIRARGVAMEQIEAARRALVAAIEDLLASRTVRCAPRCPGFRIVHVAFYGFEIGACHACGELSGYHLTDADVAGLPAAQRALARACEEPAA